MRGGACRYQKKNHCSRSFPYLRNDFQWHNYHSIIAEYQSKPQHAYLINDNYIVGHNYSVKMFAQLFYSHIYAICVYVFLKCCQLLFFFILSISWDFLLLLKHDSIKTYKTECLFNNFHPTHNFASFINSPHHSLSLYSSERSCHRHHFIAD